MIGHLPRSMLIGLAVLLWAGLAAVWLVPPMLDWNRYRADISGLASSEFGQKLTISGQVHLVLLPQPLLVADNVSLVDPDDNLTLTTRELRLRVAFWPLLAGRVETQELVLRGFSMRASWPLGSLAGRLHPPSWLASFAARIEDGDIQLGAAHLTRLNATLRLQPESGGMALNGRGEIAGQPWNVAAHLTGAGGDGAAGFDFSMEGQDRTAGTAMSFSGQLAADGTLEGQINGHGGDLAQLAPGLPGPFRAEAQLSLHDSLIAAQNISAELVGTTLRGTASLTSSDTRHIDVALSAPRLNLDAWLPMLLAERANWPDGLSGHLQLSSEAASLAGGTLRQLTTSLDLSAKQAVIQDAHAQLPGAAQLALSGRLSSGAPGDALFSGHVALSAPALRDTLDWIGKAGLIDTGRIPDPILHRADLQADLGIQAGATPEIALQNLTGLVDDTHIQGNLTLRTGPRIGVVARLDLDRLALDPLIPAGLTLAGLTARAGQTDLDLRLNIQRADWQGEHFSPVLFDAALDANHFALRKFEAQLPGTRMAASGAIATNGQISDARFDATSTAEAMPTVLAHLPPAIAAHIPAQPTTLSLILEGKPSALATRLTLDIGDLNARAAPTFNLDDGSWRATWALRHAGASRLLDNFGFPDTRSWLGEGSFSASGTMSSHGPLLAPDALRSDSFDISAGQLRANGALSLDLAGTPKLSGHLTADVLPVPLPALRSGDSLPWNLLSGWQGDIKVTAREVQGALAPLLQQFSGTFSLNGSVLSISDINAQLANGQLSGKATLDASAATPQLTAEWKIAGAQPSEAVFNLPVDLHDGQASGSLSLTASGSSPSTLLATLAGNVALSWSGVTLDGIDLARIGPKLDDSDLRAALSGGSTLFSQADISADIQNGSITLSRARFSGDSGSVEAVGLLDLVSRTEELRLAVSPAVPSPPRLGLRLSGSVDAPTRTLDLLDAARWRALYVQPTPAPVPPPAPPAVARPTTPGPGSPPASRNTPPVGTSSAGGTKPVAPNAAARPAPKPGAGQKPPASAPAQASPPTAKQTPAPLPPDAQKQKQYP